MQSKNVLILSEGFGSGHTQAGHALASGMMALCPNVHCKVMELGSVLNPTVAPFILSAYRKTVTTSPALVGLLYRKHYMKKLNRFTRLALHKIFYTRAAKLIAEQKPDIIICTHPLPNVIISRLKQLGHLTVPLYTLITDYDAHGAWITKGSNMYIVSTSDVKNILLRHGVQPESVIVTGIPVHPDFWTVQNKACVRSELNLQHMPTVLIMGGGWGILFKEDLLRHLAQWRDAIQLVFCLGSNETLAHKMKMDVDFQHPNIKILCHTKQIGKWMDASDVLLTKPGGMTCTEGLAKGLPMLFYKSIPGQEERNSQYFVNQGYGKMLTSFPEIDHSLQLLLNQKRKTTTYSDHSAYRSRQDQYLPERCASILIELLYTTSTSASRIPATGNAMLSAT